MKDNKGHCKFEMSAGILIRSKIRNALTKLKNNILFHDKTATINIEEVKSFLESDFYILIKATDKVLLFVQNWYDNMKKDVE